MSSRGPSPDRSPYGAFRSMLEECTIRPKPREEWIGLPFLLAPKLKRWLCTAAPNSDARNIDLLLEEAYNGRDLTALDVSQLIEGERACLFVFCILLECQQGHLLHRFQRHGIYDGHPINLAELEYRITGALAHDNRPAAEASRLAKDYDARQWKYYPVEFAHRRSQSWEQQRILPYIDRQLITLKGTFAKVYQVAVPEYFVTKRLQEEAASSRFVHPNHPDIGKCYHFALKAFKDGNKRLFDDETQAYRYLEKNHGMVNYLGDYSHVSDDIASHNILLEYADYDLAEYFERSPPLLSTQIELFWKALFRVPYAIDKLHTFETTRLSKSQKLQGWHADIKPDNILFVGEEFKLADPGFAKFKKQPDGNQNSAQNPTIVYGGTTTYGAPERSHQDAKILDPSSIDMWSFGCVLSEAATWVVLGRPGLNQFALLRKEAVAKCSPSQNLGQGDFFHNGTQVLKEILEWHKFLREMLRPTDKITSCVLDVVDRHLLQPAGHRLKAAELCKELGTIKFHDKSIESDDSFCTDSVSSAIIEATSKEHDEWQAWAKEQNSFDVQERKAAKSISSFLRVPGQTSSLMFPPPQDGANEISDRRRSNFQRRQSSVRGSVVIDDPTWSPPQSNQQSMAPTRRSNRSLDSTGGVSTSQPNRKSIFDAYYEYYDKQKSGVYKYLHRSLKKNIVKDNILDKYITNRDLLFLVDNAWSMQEHWSEVRFLLEVLTIRAYKLDDDGIDLMFTNGHVQKKDLKPDSEVAQFNAAVLGDDAKPTEGVSTDMSSKLSDILSGWLGDFKRSRDSGKKKKALTIIVFTDGKWEGMDDLMAVDKVIIKFSDALKEIGGKLLPDRLLSIQFLSFGNDPDALYRLRRLDNDLIYDGVPDIVDTEPSNGDLYQIFLGSIRADMDKKNDLWDPQSPSATPSSQRRADSFGGVLTQTPSATSTASNKFEHSATQQETSSSSLPVIRSTKTTPIEPPTLHRTTH